MAPSPAGAPLRVEAATRLAARNEGEAWIAPGVLASIKTMQQRASPHSIALNRVDIVTYDSQPLQRRPTSSEKPHSKPLGVLAGLRTLSSSSSSLRAAIATVPSDCITKLTPTNTLEATVVAELMGAAMCVEGSAAGERTDGTWHVPSSSPAPSAKSGASELATFGAGCYWGTEKYFAKVRGLPS
eukprot:scaffold1824_cov332-Prasinococcus_capsulatus_cf.AAC.7